MEQFGPYELLNAYANGVFPMSDSRDDPDIYFVDPKQRGILPLNGLKISKSLAKTVRKGKFEIRIDTAFMDVVHACAQPRPGHPDTWINDTILDLYSGLFAIGHAHSVECWKEERLVGGLYGVTLGTAFFGESMYSQATDASKTALVHLVGRLNAGGFTLLDAQFMTEHLRSLGAIEINKAQYHERLGIALQNIGDFTPGNYSDFEFSKSVCTSSAMGVMQSKTHTS